MTSIGKAKILPDRPPSDLRKKDNQLFNSESNSGLSITVISMQLRPDHNNFMFRDVIDTDSGSFWGF